MNRNVIFAVAVCLGSLSSVSCDLLFQPESVNLVQNSCVDVDLRLTENHVINKTIILEPEFVDVATVHPSKIIIGRNGSEKSWKVHVCGSKAGYTVVSSHIAEEKPRHLFYLHVIVAKIHLLEIVSLIVGWIYFFAWSISFYPQIYENYVRKSVVGLNFDFVALNVVGFALYSIYNCGMYYVPFLQGEYFNRNPRGLNPVQFNDVFFSVHALFATFFVIAQCFMYERGEQKVSFVSKMILILYHAIVIASGILAYTGKIHWLDFLYYCSYIKLSITLIKYVPQAAMNYARKSTVGWSIGNVLLDFVGGSFSMVQMLLDGFNYNDWNNIFGDPTKFGLGLFSVAFDIIFMYQHYILYRNPYVAHINPDTEGEAADPVAFIDKTVDETTEQNATSSSFIDQPD